MEFDGIEHVYMEITPLVTGPEEVAQLEAPTSVQVGAPVGGTDPAEPIIEAVNVVT